MQTAANYHIYMEMEGARMIQKEKIRGVGYFLMALAAGLLPFAAPDEAGAIASDGTDIAAAIDEAASRFAGPGGRRIILISDGVQTQGDALTAAEAAAQAGIRLDAVQMKPEFPAPQAELAAFELPAEAMEGRHMEAAVTVLADTQGEAALRICRQNIRRNRLTARVASLKIDAREKPARTLGEFQFLVSNPPYIPSADIDTLDASVREHEPRLALDGGADGLDFYRVICEKWRDALCENGMLFFEVGIGQADQVLRIMRSHGFGDIQIVKDLNNIPRVVYGTRVETI